MGLGDVYKRQHLLRDRHDIVIALVGSGVTETRLRAQAEQYDLRNCLLYTSDAADERSSVDLGGRRIIKKKNKETSKRSTLHKTNKDKQTN